MRQINWRIRQEVIQLFFLGHAYDEIADQLGVAKGSVVNIVREYRDGTLQLPSDLLDFVDELRQVAVDLRSHTTSVKRMKTCLELQDKLETVGLSEDEVGRWLSVCQRFASPDVSAEQFAQAALELARLTSGFGMGYVRVVEDCEAKMRMLRELNEELETKRAGLLDCESELRKARADLREATQQLERQAHVPERRIIAHTISHVCQS